jgi:hypothetical protein
MADYFETMHRATSRVSFLPDFWFTHAEFLVLKINGEKVLIDYIGTMAADWMFEVWQGNFNFTNGDLYHFHIIFTHTDCSPAHVYCPIDVSLELKMTTEWPYNFVRYDGVVIINTTDGNIFRSFYNN